MDNRDKVISFVRMRGPSLPVHISKEIGTNILMASAIMSELVSRGDLKVSNIKVGGSPLYYIKGQEYKLQQFSDRLNPKDRHTFELLRNKKILRDKSLEPIERVSLRQLKDFAVPLKVKIKEEVELFWKWYLLQNVEAESLIKGMLSPKTEKVPEPAPPKPVVTPKETKQKELFVPLDKDVKSEEKPKPRKPRKDIRSPITKDDFLDEVAEYFRKNRIKIIEKEIIRKGSEIDFLIELPSTVGSLRYYCKAKSKKRSNDADLAAAFVQGQSKKLPVLYLAGDLTKRAKEMVDKEFKGMTIRTLKDGD